MKLISLSLTNFQKHRSFQGQFSDGLNLIVGPNWAGKTTLLRAVTYALFGSAAIDVKVPRLVTAGETRMQVELVFEIDGLAYRIKRTKNAATISSDGQELATGQTQVTAYVEKLLQRSAKHFMHFNVVQQEDAQQLLKLGGAKLSKMLNEVTGIDLIDQVTACASLQFTEHKWAIPEQQTAAAEFARLQKEREEAESHYQSLIGRLQKEETADRQSKEEVKRLEVEVDQLERALIAAERVKVRRAELLGQLNAVKGSISRFEAQLEPVDLEALQRLYERSQEATRGYEKSLDVQRELKRLRKRSSDLTIELQRLPTDTELQQIITSIDVASLDQEKTKHDEALFKAKDLVSRLEKQKSGAVCPTCQRPYVDLDVHRLEQRLEGARKSLDSAISQRTKFLSDLEKEVGRLTLAKDQLEQRAKQKIELDETVKKVDEIAQTPIPVFEEVERIQAEYLKAYSAYQNQAAKQREIQALEEEQQRILKELNQIKVEHVDESSLVAARQQLSAARAKRETLVEQLSQFRSMKKQYVEYFSSTDVAISAAHRKLHEVREKATLADKLNRLMKYLRKNRDRYSQQIWDQLLSYTSSFIAEATNGDTSQLTRSADGEFVYVENGVEFPAELCSGMQGAILGVSLKLALGAALGAKGGVLLLDEATAGGTDENSLLFTSLLKQYGRQVVLVTHRSADAVSADNVIEL